MSVRVAGLTLTTLLVSQALTTGVLLPMEWISTVGVVEIAGIRLDFGLLDPRVNLTTLMLLVALGFYWLVARVSSKSHFDEPRKVAPHDLLLDLSGKSMLRAREEFEADRTTLNQYEDPGGARVTDDRLWTVHPILHRLRRLHFGLGILFIAMSVEVWIGRMTVAVALAVAMLVAFSLSWMTTYLPEARWVWVVTSLMPVLSLGALLAAILSIWMPGSGLYLEELHTMTFGVALILGLAALLSLFAGPLSVGALVFATFIGVTMGAAAGLFVDAVLGTDILRSAGVGWVSVATLLFLATLLVVALVLTLVGRVAEEHGATRPLPREFGRWRRMVLRRVELETRILFYAAAFLGLAVFIAVGFVAYRHGLQLRDTEGAALFAFWGTLVAGLDVGALPPFPQGLVVFSISSVVLPMGYFAFRSIRKGWTGGKDGEGRRRQVGILWDLGSFWPRWYHPLAPPGYGPRSVRDLGAAIQDLPTESVLGAHSQGSLITAVALHRTRSKIAYITYGSQLGILYPRMFPNVGIPNLVADVAELCPAWINLWRDTDPIGGHFVTNPQVENERITESLGHSGYEITDNYRDARLRISGLDEDCEPTEPGNETGGQVSDTIHE